LRNDAEGDAYRNAQRLEEGQFICVIPRLRHTPYYRIHNRQRTGADGIRDAINERTTEQDHAKLRDMIVGYVRNTGNKVLACAEMTYQIEMVREVLAQARRAYSGYPKGIVQTVSSASSATGSSGVLARFCNSRSRNQAKITGVTIRM
jgi:hypothetical protein